MLKHSREKRQLIAVCSCSLGSALQEIVILKAMLHGTKMEEFCSPWKKVRFNNSQCPEIHRQVYA